MCEHIRNPLNRSDFTYIHNIDQMFSLKISLSSFRLWSLFSPESWNNDFYDSDGKAAFQNTYLNEAWNWEPKQHISLTNRPIKPPIDNTPVFKSITASECCKDTSIGCTWEVVILFNRATLYANSQVSGGLIFRCGSSVGIKITFLYLWTPHTELIVFTTFKLSSVYTCRLNRDLADLVREIRA